MLLEIYINCEVKSYINVFELPSTVFMPILIWNEQCLPLLKAFFSDLS